MTDTHRDSGWPERFTAGVAGEIKRYREAKGWSFQQLAEACSELQYPTLRTTLANLENGRRKSITLHEVLVLAEALGVPPVQLVFPHLPEGDVEYLPGRTDISWHALKWFTGETTPPRDLATASRRELPLAMMHELDTIQTKQVELQQDLEKAKADAADAHHELRQHQPWSVTKTGELTAAGQINKDNFEGSADHADRMVSLIQGQITQLRNTERLIRDTLKATGFTITTEDDPNV